MVTAVDETGKVTRSRGAGFAKEVSTSEGKRIKVLL